MFPVAPFAIYFAYFVFALVGLIIGGISGTITAILLKIRIKLKEIAKDAFIGAVAFMGMWLLIITWRFQFPFLVPAILAVALPALHEFIHSRA